MFHFNIANRNIWCFNCCPIKVNVECISGDHPQTGFYSALDLNYAVLSTYKLGRLQLHNFIELACSTTWQSDQFARLEPKLNFSVWPIPWLSPPITWFKCLLLNFDVNIPNRVVSQQFVYFNSIYTNWPV